MSVPDIPVMCDIESFGVTPGDVVLSIAMVPFYHKFGNVVKPFYIKIDVQSSIDAGFVVEEETVSWWGDQDPKVFEEAISGKVPVIEAFSQMTEYLKSLPGTPLIFGCGSDFDNVMLQTSYKKLGMEVPWTHKHNRCYRTLFNVFKDKVSRVKPADAHNALSDASAQAAQCEKILEWVDNAVLPDNMLNNIADFVVEAASKAKEFNIDTDTILGIILDHIKSLGNVSISDCEATTAYVNQ